MNDGNWKWRIYHVDDTTTSEIIDKGNVSNSQPIAEVMLWSSKNKMQLNSVKCKKLKIFCSDKTSDFDPLTVNDKEIEIVNSVVKFNHHR